MTVPMTRRGFIKGATATAAVGALGGGVGYSYWESGDLQTHSLTIPLEGLPEGFHGLRILFLSDTHRGVFISSDYVAGAVNLANSLHPDLVLLGGDYVDSDPSYIVSVMEELGKLTAPLGVFAVQGNRDIRANRIFTSKELAQQGIEELTNKGCWIQRNGSKLWLCGFDDATIGHPDVPAGLSGASPDAVILAVTHNPSLVNSLNDSRIKLVLSGHTHGGQINLPLIGRPFIPPGCEKYQIGLVQAPHTTAFISSGVGVAYLPIRFRCPPEVALITLVAA